MTDRVERIPACTTKGCPFPRSPSWHIPFCGHGTVGHHHHVPKRSQGGKKIVAFLCPRCHDRVDNTPDWDNAVAPGEDGRLEYILWDTRTEGGWNSPLICRPIDPKKGEAGRAAAERGADEEPPGSGVPAEPLVAHSAAAPPASPLSPAGEGGAGEFGHSLRLTSVSDRPPIPSPAEPSFYPVGGDYCRRGMWLLFLALRLQKMTTEAAFEIGDWVNEGENTLGEAAHQFFGVFSYWQIATWASVARRVPELGRHKELPFSHHQAVAALPEPKQEEMLDKAAEQAWPLRTLREAVQGPSEPQPRVKRWTWQELSDKAAEFSDANLPGVGTIGGFLDWLEAS